MGADDRVRVALGEGGLDLGAEAARVKALSGNTGAVVLFLGVARGESQGREVTGLEFESYGAMAERELRALGAEALEKFGLSGLSILHRLGALAPGEDIVLIVAGAAHRAAAFEAARWCIDELKRRVPIWKKEVFGDGQAWVQETP